MGTLPNGCRPEADLRLEIERAQQLLARHEPTAQGACTCGESWPCLTADVAADHAACAMACLAQLRIGQR